MAIGQRGFHRYLKQQRAMGRSEPTREDKAAYLQGDIQANLAMANQQRQTGIQERAQQAQEGQFAQNLAQTRRQNKTTNRQWEQQFGMQEDAQKQQERWNKLRGISEVAKLGMEAAPMLRGAGQWAAGKMGFGGGYEPDYGGGQFEQFDQGYDVQGGGYGMEPSYDGGGYQDQGWESGGDFQQPPQEFDYSQFDWDGGGSGWMDF